MCICFLEQSVHSKANYYICLSVKLYFFEILGVQLNLFSLFFIYIFYNSDHSFLLTLLYWIFVEACVHGLVGSRNLRLKFNMLICPVELCAQIWNVLSFLQCQRGSDSTLNFHEAVH